MPPEVPWPYSLTASNGHLGARAAAKKKRLFKFEPTNEELAGLFLCLAVLIRNESRNGRNNKRGRNRCR
jgi:hypothetical protein